ncbi:MAG TPA: gephyrin-like molybdotransferase receptor GlpR [Mycobacterium sp.]|nr:gephyrin-like molybdotransferase receptor GlpR [Mycobacterium sp.]
MPSIPQSLLWISLVVLWLFVLVPMLISKRDTVRRTSDVALATRVLNTGRSARLIKRRGPAAGHRSDPDWRPMHDDRDEHEDYSDFSGDEAKTAPRKVIVLAAAKPVEVESESEYLDVDVVEEDSGALPLGATARQRLEDPVLPLDFTTAADVGAAPDEVEEPDEAEEPAEAVYEAGPPTAAIRTPADAEFEIDERVAGPVDEVVEDDVLEEQPVDEVVEDEAFDDTVEDEPADEIDEELEYRAEGTDHDYETVDDSSGLEAVSESDLDDSMSPPRRDRYQTKTAAAVSARKFAFRKRMLMSMAALLLVSGVAAVFLGSAMWWVCGTVGAVTVLYLGYLRRQTRIEEQLRRRRAQRMARSRLGVENTKDQEFDVVPSRLRRPGAVVLEIDDEDPVFEHLDYATFGEYHLQRAAGE